MKSVFDIAKSHISLPVSKDINALRQVLRDWHHYTEKLPLQAKTTHTASLCISLHSTCKSKKEYSSNSNKSRLLREKLNLHKESFDNSGEVGGSYTKYIPLQLWTALLPWEVQRGLSRSELRLPEKDENNSNNNNNNNNNIVEKEEEDDPFGVVTTQAKSINNTMCTSSILKPISNFSSSPGMLFIMDTNAAAQGLNFWSGAILQSIDIAFIAPVEPASTNSSSFQELRQRYFNNCVEKGECDLRNYFPDAELDSPTVSFAVQSYSYLDPFPYCDKKKGGIVNNNQRKHLAEPSEGIITGGLQNNNNIDNNKSLRYVLETTRHLFRDSIASAIQEYHQLYSESNNIKQGGKGKESDDDLEITITLTFSDSLKEEIREKARLYINYVKPLEEHISYYIKYQNSDISSTQNKNIINNKEDNIESNNNNNNNNNSIAIHNSNSIIPSDSNSNSTSNIIKPSRLIENNEIYSMTLRSPILVDEMEGNPVVLAPSVFGRHEAPTLYRAQKEQQQLISAKALAKYPKTSPRMPILPPIDYELFDLCLRLGLCQEDVIYYYYGRIMREWKKELKRLRNYSLNTSINSNNNNNSSSNSNEEEKEGISEGNIYRMLLLVRDPSIQVPGELSACVEAVAQRRGINIVE